MSTEGSPGYPDGNLAPEVGPQRRRRHLVVAYDSSSSSPLDLVSAIGHLCEIVWVVDSGGPSLGSFSRLLPRLGRVIDSNGETPEEVAERLRGTVIDGVIAFADSQLAVASAIAESLGLARNPAEVIDRLSDKYLQREALLSAGIATPRFRRIADTSTSAQVIEAISGLEFPLVLKPLRGHSSRGVQVVDDLPTLTAVFDSRSSTAQFVADDYIAEEYLTGRVAPELQAIGDYVSVESIVQDGNPVPLAITGKFPLVAPFRESGNFMPHPFEAEEASAILGLSVEVALALGVQCGALHTEIKLTPHGPRVIEVNGRIGGGGIDSIFTKTHGYSLTELAVRVACRDGVDLVAERPKRWSGPFAFEFFVQPPMLARRLRSIAGANELVGIEGVDSVLVNKVPDDELHWESGSQGYLMQVGGHVDDRAGLFSMPGTIVDSLEMAFD